MSQNTMLESNGTSEMMEPWTRGEKALIVGGTIAAEAIYFAVWHYFLSNMLQDFGFFVHVCAWLFMSSIAISTILMSGIALQSPALLLAAISRLKRNRLESPSRRGLDMAMERSLFAEAAEGGAFAAVLAGPAALLILMEICAAIALTLYIFPISGQSVWAVINTILMFPALIAARNLLLAAEMLLAMRKSERV